MSRLPEAPAIRQPLIALGPFLSAGDYRPNRTTLTANGQKLRYLLTYNGQPSAGPTSQNAHYVFKHVLLSHSRRWTLSFIFCIQERSIRTRDCHEQQLLMMIDMSPSGLSNCSVAYRFEQNEWSTGSTSFDPFSHLKNADTTFCSRAGKHQWSDTPITDLEQKYFDVETKG